MVYIIVITVAAFLLLSSLAEAFSSPRLPSTPSAVIVSHVGWRTGIDVINAGRRARIVVRTLSTDENNEIDELETEASTTGLFIPGFSDKFAKEEEVSKAPPIEKSVIRKTKEQQQLQPAKEIPQPRPPSSSSSNKEKTEKSAFSELPKLSLPSISFPNLNPFGGKKLVPTPPSMPPPRGNIEESIASAVGGLVAGSGLGLYADIFTDFLSDTDLPSLVPPATLGVALGIGAYVGAGQRNFVGKSIRFIFGGPILGLRDNISNTITRKIDEIKAAPGKFVDAVEQSIEDTVDEIKATPGKILDAVEKKIEDTVDDIKATPGKIADAVEQRIEDEVDAVMKKIDQTVEEIKATPGKIADSIEEAIEVAVEDVVEAVEEVVSIPGRKLEEIQARLARITQAQTNVDKPTPTPPSGKSLPIPSPPVQQQRSSFLPDQKLELPSFTFPSVSPVKPAVVSAKSMPPPKETPRLSIPPKVNIPDRPKPKPPLEKEQKKDNFVFTEAALKDFIAKDKPKSMEVDKPMPTLKANAINPKKKTIVSVPPVKGRPTFSLFGLGGGKPETIVVKAAIPSKSVSTTANAVAPNGVPTITKWKLNPDDNSITGLISGSASYDDGEPVTTSPIVGVATANSVVRTKSGSRYFLGEEGSKGLFSFFGSGGVKSESAEAPAPTPLIPTGPSSSGIADKIASEKKRIEEKQAKAKRDALVQAQRDAEKQASEDTKRIRDAQEEERRINAKKRKQIERQRQLDIDRQKQQQSLNSKQSTLKEDKPAPSFTTPTISLFPFRSEESKEGVSAPKATVTVTVTVSAAPRGVPTINKWTLDSDNAISGIISGSRSFDDGAPVTTSPIVGSAVSGSVVQTKSGSRYFLGDELTGGGFFSLFGGGKDVSPEVKAPPKKDLAAEARKEAKEAQRKAQAKAKMDAEEGKRRIAKEVAAKREAEVQARKQADATARREAEIQTRRQVEEDRKQAIEAQKRTAAAATAQKKLEEDKEKREAEEKKRIVFEKSERQRKMQQAEQTISKSPRGVTVSLFGFGAFKSDESSTVSTKAPTVTLATTAPPRGVPVISRWKQERDGSITGVITGSASLNDGDRITTSPIKGVAIGGTVVTTSSGSRYYLVESNSAISKTPDEAKAAANSRAEAAAAAAAKKVAAVKATKEAATKSEALARQKEAIEKAKREKVAEAKRATLTMKQEREDKAKRASPTLTVAGSSKSPTISLFGLGEKLEPEPTSTPAKSQAKSLAPKGLPTIIGWRLNRDGSISGRISGSPNFRDGEQVTTSPITQGRVESGSTVKTGSGSKYFLR